MIIHIDMDSFYASVEVREHPELARQPVAVGGSAAGRGVVAAANYEARKFGVRSAASVVRRCPQLVCLPVNMPLYVEVSKQIHEIFNRYTSEIEPLSLDEIGFPLALARSSVPDQENSNSPPAIHQS